MAGFATTSICRPVDIHNGIRLALRDGNRPLGCLVLSRPPGSRPFGREDERRLGLARSFLSHAIARREAVPPVASGGKEVAEAMPALVIVNRQADVQYISPEAERLLRMLVWRPGLPAHEFVSDYVAMARRWFSPLIRRLTAVEAGKDYAAAPATTVRNPWGSFSCRAFFMHGMAPGVPSLIGIYLSRFVPVDLRLLGHPEVQALPQREKEVCLLLAEGHSAAEMARRLAISQHTVVSHTRSLYNRFRVAGREALLDRLLGDAPVAAMAV
jgi:DNA-binding CsgD family transcriptional regulator